VNDDRGHPLALWGTVACLALGLVLFVTSTAPALAERQLLLSVEKDLAHDLRQFHNLLRAFESRGLHGTPDRGGEHDLQALLVAIDAMGHTPAELLALYPQDPDGPENLRAGSGR